MLVHVVNQTDQVMPIPVVLQRLDLGYSTLRNSSETFFIENVFVSIHDPYLTNKNDITLFLMLDLFFSFFFLPCKFAFKHILINMNYMWDLLMYYYPLCKL